MQCSRQDSCMDLSIITVCSLFHVPLISPGTWLCVGTCPHNIHTGAALLNSLLLCGHRTIPWDSCARLPASSCRCWRNPAPYSFRLHKGENTSYELWHQPPMSVWGDEHWEQLLYGLSCLPLSKPDQSYCHEHLWSVLIQFSYQWCYTSDCHCPLTRNPQLTARGWIASLQVSNLLSIMGNSRG